MEAKIRLQSNLGWIFAVLRSSNVFGFEGTFQKKKKGYQSVVIKRRLGLFYGRNAVEQFFYRIGNLFLYHKNAPQGLHS